MLKLYGKHNSKCSVYINLFDPQQFFEVGTIVTISPIYSCIQRVSDLPGYQQQGTLCTCPMLYSSRFCVRLSGTPKRQNYNKSSVPLWDI